MRLPGRHPAHLTYNVRTGRTYTTRRLHKLAAHKAQERASLHVVREPRRPDRRSSILAAAMRREGGTR